jgi:hypothetical protein
MYSWFIDLYFPCTGYNPFKTLPLFKHEMFIACPTPLVARAGEEGRRKKPPPEAAKKEEMYPNSSQPPPLLGSCVLQYSF